MGYILLAMLHSLWSPCPFVLPASPHCWTPQAFVYYQATVRISHQSIFILDIARSFRV